MHASTHAFVEPVDNCKHLHWHTEAGKYLPQQLSVSREEHILYEYSKVNSVHVPASSGLFFLQSADIK